MEEVIIAIIALVAVAAIAVAAWLWMDRRKGAQLRDRFGEEEYRRVRTREGGRRQADAELERRQKRVENYDIRPLTHSQYDHYSDRWRTVQSAFVDSPTSSVHEADDLVAEVMNARGYPMEDFDERAADLSVDHASVVQNYCRAHAIAVSDRRGEASTEDLRQAFVHYRALFDKLLVSTEQHQEVSR
ncbi:MAG TPA: hypothetical protein VMR52_11185 [Dehalococcoidia bacterium]|nr:hypothetical protein [Dehalococcoidia bacterium]